MTNDMTNDLVTRLHEATNQLIQVLHSPSNGLTVAEAAHIARMVLRAQKAIENAYAVTRERL